MDVLKGRDFARWEAGEMLPDDALCNAVKEMERGLIDADLGGSLYKKRVGSSWRRRMRRIPDRAVGRLGDRYVFLHGFAKKDKANITG